MSNTFHRTYMHTLVSESIFNMIFCCFQLLVIVRILWYLIRDFEKKISFIFEKKHEKENIFFMTFIHSWKKNDSKKKEKKSAFTLLIPLGDACFFFMAILSRVNLIRVSALRFTKTAQRTEELLENTLSAILNQSAAECVCVSHNAIFKFIFSFFTEFQIHSIANWHFLAHNVYAQWRKYTFKFIIFF